MRKYIGKLSVLLMLLSLLLTGCFSGSVDELYTLPKLPEDYQKLQEKIEQVLAQNSAETAAPLTGELSQPVQLQDLDGDGVKEAIAFFRVTTDDRPLKIYIYRQSDEDYELACMIEGAGAAINSIAYENLDDSPEKELVVSWQMSEKVYSLAAYSISTGQAVELMRTNYTDFCLFDLDMDNQKEIIVLQAGSIVGGGRIELYNYREVLALESSALLSQNITSYVSGGMQTGFLQELVPAVFVPSNYGENGRITDIFAWRDGRIQNITMDPTTGESSGTIRWYTQVTGSDINGDGIMELPEPYALPDPKQTSTAVNFWAIRWRQFDVNGKPTTIFTTYHNERDDWYFVLPQAWLGQVSLSRSDQAGGNERAVIFSRWEAGSEEDPEPFLIIYRLTGDNRVRRASMSGRFRLWPLQGDGTDVIYAAKLLDSDWDCGLSEEDVRAAFSLITGSGSNG